MKKNKILNELNSMDSERLDILKSASTFTSEQIKILISAIKDLGAVTTGEEKQEVFNKYIKLIDEYKASLEPIF